MKQLWWKSSLRLLFVLSVTMVTLQTLPAQCLLSQARLHLDVGVSRWEQLCASQPGGCRRARKPAGSGREQPGSLSLPRTASAARRRFPATVPDRAPPAGAAALLSALLHGVWELDVSGARCVFTGRQAAAAAGRQAPRAPIMAPVLRQESPRSFRWHAKGSWRRKLASRFRGKRRRIRIKEWKNPPTGEKQEYF